MRQKIQIVLVFGVTAVLAWWVPGPDGGPQSKKEIVRSTRKVGNSRGGHREASRRLWHDLQLDGETVAEQMRRVVVLASTIPVSEIKRLYESGVLASLDKRLLAIFEEIALERWLEEDPGEMMDWLATSQVARLDVYLAIWAGWGPDQAAGFVEKQPVSRQNFLMRSVFREMLKRNPDQAMEMARDHFVTSNNLMDGPLDGIVYQLALHDREAFLRIRADWPTGMQEATRHSLGAAMLKENFRGGLEFLARDDAGWQAMVGALMMDREGGVSQALVESAGQLPSGWMEKILSDPGIGRWGHRFLGLLGQDATTLGVTEEVFAHFARKVSSNGSGFQALDKQGRERVMDLVNRPSLDLATRKSLLRSQIRWWPQSKEDDLRGWLDRLEDDALSDVADRSRRQRAENWQPRPLENPQDRLRKMASGESDDDFRVGTWTREEIAEAGRTFTSFSAAEKERTLRVLSRETLIDTVPVDFAADLLKGGFDLSEQGVKLPEVMKQLPEFVTYWSGREPARAAAWVEALPEGEARQEAVGRVAREWREFSVAEVRGWMEQLPEAERAEVAQVLAEN